VKLNESSLGGQKIKEGIYDVSGKSLPNKMRKKYADLRNVRNK
jgi:hypothetical protein